MDASDRVNNHNINHTTTSSTPPPRIRQQRQQQQPHEWQRRTTHGFGMRLCLGPRVCFSFFPHVLTYAQGGRNAQWRNQLWLRRQSLVSQVSFPFFTSFLLAIIYKRTTRMEWERRPRRHDAPATHNNGRDDRCHQGETKAATATGAAAGVPGTTGGTRR